jgi:hypothetical protein
VERRRPGRQQGVEQAEAPQHGDATGHQSLAARLVAGETGPVEDDGPVTGPRQEQGRGGAAGAGPHHHDVGILGAHRPILRSPLVAAARLL